MRDNCCVKYGKSTETFGIFLALGRVIFSHGQSEHEQPFLFYTKKAGLSFNLLHNEHLVFRLVGDFPCTPLDDRALL